MCMSCGCGKKKGQPGYGKGKPSAKGLSSKQKKIAAVAGDKNAIDAMDLAVLRNRKKAQAGSVSDEKILDGDTIEELKDTPGNSTHQCAIHVKHATMGEAVH